MFVDLCAINNKEKKKSKSCFELSHHLGSFSEIQKQKGNRTVSDLFVDVSRSKTAALKTAVRFVSISANHSILSLPAKLTCSSHSHFVQI